MKLPAGKGSNSNRNIIFGGVVGAAGLISLLVW
jgi:hypothetical protein